MNLRSFDKWLMAEKENKNNNQQRQDSGSSRDSFSDGRPIEESVRRDSDQPTQTEDSGPLAQTGQSGDLQKAIKDK